jgi:hypothetical protein
MLTAEDANDLRQQRNRRYYEGDSVLRRRMARRLGGSRPLRGCPGDEDKRQRKSTNQGVAIVANDLVYRHSDIPFRFPHEPIR